METEMEDRVYLTRGDLIGSYLGETELKTMEKLEAYSDKVIHIDLQQGPNDLYASQALKTVDDFSQSHTDTVIIKDVTDIMLREMEKICSNNSLQDTTTPEEIEQCRSMITNSLEKHREFVNCLDVEQLTHNYQEQYETLTKNLSPKEKELFTFETYDSIVQSTKNILTFIKNAYSL